MEGEGQGGGWRRERPGGGWREGGPAAEVAGGGRVDLRRQSLREKELEDGGLFGGETTEMLMSDLCRRRIGTGGVERICATTASRASELWPTTERVAR